MGGVVWRTEPGHKWQSMRSETYRCTSQFATLVNWKSEVTGRPPDGVPLKSEKEERRAENRGRIGPKKVERWYDEGAVGCLSQNHPSEHVMEWSFGFFH